MYSASIYELNIIIHCMDFFNVQTLNNKIVGYCCFTLHLITDHLIHDFFCTAVFFIKIYFMIKADIFC